MFPEQEQALATIPAPNLEQPIEVLLRMGYPHDFSPSGVPTCVFGTTELGVVKRAAIAGETSLAEAHYHSDAVLITCSQWAKQGFLASGACPERTIVVPLGIDPSLYHPLSPAERTALRRQLGWDDFFIVLNVGGMGRNKGIPMLLAAIAILAQQYPHIRLVLKGMDTLYPSERLIRDFASELPESEQQQLSQRLIYLGQTLSFADMARLYQAADAYVSPYFAEGFNLPVLEAIACGLPTICTAGGATDDFTNDEVALRIASHIQPVQVEDSWGGVLVPDFEHLLTHLETLITQPAVAAGLSQRGSHFVHQHFTWHHTIVQLLTVFQRLKATR
ncbi:MAG: glycosyltransferase family 4 protein [Cyanobacteriota bacterium SKYGB_h_bin112]|nr:glycosyltransferase family 4 protein [Cyanobacteriota bacterium SKYGB_h_bin112]